MSLEKCKIYFFKVLRNCKDYSTNFRFEIFEAKNSLNHYFRHLIAHKRSTERETLPFIFFFFFLIIATLLSQRLKTYCNSNKTSGASCSIYHLDLEELK